MAIPVPTIRADLDGFALYLEPPESAEPGEFVAVFPTWAEAVAALHAPRAAGALLGAA